MAVRLAQLGHSAAVLEKAAFPRPHTGESLAPDILGVLDALGVRGSVERQGFLRPDAALVRWGAETAVRPTDVPGFQVDRAGFDLLLLREAAAAGARIVQPCGPLRIEWDPRAAWKIESSSGTVQARYLVDATGRRGRLGGRKRRVSRPLFALYAYWKDTGVRGPETRVEAGESTWYWGAPLPDGSFNATVFLAPGSIGEDREARYERLLQRSVLLKGCVAGRRLGRVLCCDASSYCDEEPVGESVLKIGEANYSIDPLSSQGVRAAMGSAVHGAIVLNTMLRRPDSAATACRFYRARQQEAVELHRLWAGRHYAGPARIYGTAFWRSRAVEDRPPAAATDNAALDPETWIALAPETRIVATARIEGDFIVEGRAVEHPGLARPLAWLDGYDVPDLLQQLTVPARVTDVVSRWSGEMPGARAGDLIAELYRLGIVIRRSGIA